MRKGVVVARSTPRVDETVLVDMAGTASSITVGSPAWYAWLEHATTFAFRGAQGSFTARKERRGQTGWFWKAYRKHNGRLYRAYLGKSADVTLDRLHAIAQELAQNTLEPPVFEQADVAATLSVAVGDQPSQRLRTTHSSSTPPLAQAPSLLATKLFMPSARPQLVARPRLLARLEAGLGSKLMLLSAPAGFGKTTLLIQGLEAWRLRRAESVDVQASNHASLASPVAWVSLEAADSEPLRFWSYVITALDTFQPGSTAIPLRLLESPKPLPIETVLTPLLNAFSGLPTDAVLVLDDYHLIDAPAIHTALMFLLDHLPPRLHLVITTRADPPLPLTRLRARQQLTELRTADLRFTADEATAFLNDLMGLPLSDGDVAALEARTEGWIAGLQLAALALRDRTDHASFIAAFSGSHRFVVDYLAEEVLDSLPRHLQTFLQQTCILDRLCGPLCDALVLGSEPAANHGAQAYSQLVLEELDRANLFLIPLDDRRHWYRYHNLFAEVLRQRLVSGASAEAVALLHQRASSWYEAQQLISEAIDHALAARAFNDAARLIERIQWIVIAQNATSPTLAAWLAALPEAVVLAHPRLCLAQALLAKQNTVALLEQWVRQAEMAVERAAPEADSDTVRGELAAFQATLAMYSGHPETAIELARKALAAMPLDNTILRGTAMMIESQALLWQGNITGAEAAFGRIAGTVTLANLSGTIVAACSQAYLQRAAGRLEMARTTCQHMFERTIQLGAATMPDVGFIIVGLADLARERNDLPAAEQYVTNALALNAPSTDPLLRQLILLVQARLQYAQGNLDGALATIHEARQINHAASQLFDGILAGFAVQLALARGDAVSVDSFDGASADAATAVSRVSPLFMVYVAEHSRIAPIQALIAAGQTRSDTSLLQRALEQIETWHALAESSGLVWLRIKLYALEAIAAYTLGEEDRALAALEQALALADPERLVRVFVDEGAPIGALLAHVAGRRARGDPLRAYAEQLLAAFPASSGQGSTADASEAAHPSLRPQSSALVEALSARELEVLRLIADGHSNQAIADSLIVAVSTVKRHINNIYGKLGVQSRTQALVRARELQLL